MHDPDLNHAAPSAEPAAQAHVPPGLALKAALLLVFTVVLIAASGLYLLYARGMFEPTQTLVLITDDSEGVVVGMDMSFSGFPIGRVRRLELAADGNARIVIDVPRKDARWLRTSSVFTLVRSLVGGTAIRAYSGVMTDPPLPDGAERTVLRGDATAEIPRVLAAAREALDNIAALTSEEAALRRTLAHLQTATERLQGPQGGLGLLFGNEKDAQQFTATLARTHTLATRLDAMAAQAQTQVFGPQGVMPDVKATVQQLTALAAEARNSVKKLDAVLAEAQAVGSNVRGATTDLPALRAEVEANLRKIETLMNEVQRKWPFATDPALRLP